MRKIAVISIIMVASILGSSGAALAGGGLRYIVKPGDTLAKIGSKYSVDYHLIMQNNNLTSVLIRPGLELNIPEGNLIPAANTAINTDVNTVSESYSNVYTVKRGDTLWDISRKYGVSVADIKQVNGLTSSLINPGLKLVIFKKDSPKPAVKAVASSRADLGREEIRLLAKLIHAESRGESLEGKIAVGAVIINRVRSSAFPNTVSGVIYQKTRNGYQFSPVGNGQINLEPDQTAFYAAERAIRGADPTEGAVFFYNPETSTDRWIRTLPITKVIGNHVFAK